MAQLFKPAANTIASLSLFLGAAVPFGILVVGSQITRSPANTKVDIPLEQPIPFSHKHHVKELGIDCRYCHVTVEEQAHASVPSTEVCMTCHSQVWTNSPMLDPVRASYENNTPIQWVKVNAVPDFVYFNHAIHIAKGISCNTCHGAVQDMHITWKGQAFTMAWCLDCHRDPSKFMYEEPKQTAKREEGEAVNLLTPREQVFELYRKISNGEPLSQVEERLAEGLIQRVPQDEIHKGYKLMNERKINKNQLMDCYVCHH
ncbi:MAG: cytochrome c family protein [Fimbriimonadaceae bacterium]|jgi:hypothetical protein|nr:cytochrome c family protein [Fimbriimonadaceae bacterium]